MKLSEEQVKEIVLKFRIRHGWYVTKTKAEKVFDDWWKEERGHYEFHNIPDSLRQVKKIDMSRCIESGIDVEFKYLESDEWIIGNLHSINNDIYTDIKSTNFKHCRPRMNHPYAFPTGCDKPPIPEGFMTRIWYREDVRGHSHLHNIHTHKINWYNVIMIEVLRLAEKYEL